MEFTIFRKSWRRGGSEVETVGGVEQLGETHLLNTSDMLCCLGMIAIQTGVPAKEIIGIGCPQDIDREFIPKKFPLAKVSSAFGLSDTQLATSAIDINDDADISEKERETNLTRLFAKRGHTLKFVNRLAPKAWRIARG